MRIQNCQNNDYNTNFGAKYTKGSIRFLKENVSNFVGGEDFDLAKEALENLIQAKNRADNLLVDINYGNYGFVSCSARHANGESKKFHYPVIGPQEDGGYSDADDLLTMAEFINSDSFVKEVNRVMMLHYTRKSKLPFFKKLKENIIEYTKIDEWGKELLEAIEDISNPNGVFIIKKDGSIVRRKGLSYVMEILAEEFRKQKNEPQNKDKLFVEKRFRQDVLLKLINKLGE